MAASRSLRKVRETRHFDLPSVAKYAGISADRLNQFEKGEREPSSRQLERLADTYGLASYLLGADTIPNLPETLADFRKASPRAAHLSPAGMSRIWSAEEVSSVAAQLLEAVNLKQPTWSNEVPAGKPTVEKALAIRSFFDMWLQKRQASFGFSGTIEQRFLSAFRLFLEVQGSIVRINDAPAEDYLGFFLEPENAVPTIFVNRKISAPKAQLFTLLHEYAHSLMGLAGVSNPFVVKNDVERTCNKFAAEFLAPTADFSALAEKQPSGIRKDIFRYIEAVSRSSLLSMHATAIRLIETGHISQGQLKIWEIHRKSLLPKQLKQEEKDEESETQSGGAVHAKQLGEVGYLPSYVAKLAFDKKFVDSADVQSGIGLAISLQEKAFDLVARRFEAAAH
jgi:Zn-dependent peptidase ImmA (M78 family)/transcriptional regulator with XRE-family HTH domain